MERAKGGGARLREQAARDRKVAEVTAQYEQAAVALEDAERLTVGSQLGIILKTKGIKVGDLVVNWGGTDQLIDIDEFVPVLGV